MKILSGAFVGVACGMLAYDKPMWVTGASTILFVLAFLVEDVFRRNR